MNKRQEPVSSRVNKKNDKEVHKAMGKDTVLEPVKAQKSISVDSVIHKNKNPKKHSKRTTPHEKIEGSTPAHVHTENEHWNNALRKQTDIRTKTLTKKLSKKHRAP